MCTQLVRLLKNKAYTIDINTQTLPYLWNSGIMIQLQWSGVLFIIIKTQMLSFYNTCLHVICWGLSL